MCNAFDRIWSRWQDFSVVVFLTAHNVCLLVRGGRIVRGGGFPRLLLVVSRLQNNFTHRL